ncbi:MAG: nucleotidyltransferase family protein [Anaerolineales bacterium]|nr:nucleotidyltransferase family protein [Anaerolineales bacterium]
MKTDADTKPRKIKEQPAVYIINKAEIKPAFIKERIPFSQEKIDAFCKKWKISEFSFFGSILRDDFRPDSDVDVLVSFSANAGWSLFDLVDMQQELETMFNRKVDLVEKEALKNPYRRHSILNGREILYASQ